MPPNVIIAFCKKKMHLLGMCYDIFHTVYSVILGGFWELTNT